VSAGATRSIGLLVGAVLASGCGRGAETGARAVDELDATPLGAHAGWVNGCPPEMARIAGQAFCVDRYEAYVVEIDASGNEEPHSPYLVVAGLRVRAKSMRDTVPQAYISQVEASAACANAGKYLCSANEFSYACRGGPDSGAHYPYGGTVHMPGYCNEGKGSFFGLLPRQRGRTPTLNDPELNQVEGGLARTGSYPKCVSPSGIYDCVGNLHEWSSDPADVNGHGRFHGGFYGDADENGPGCLYVTSAHDLAYHDYSTGFRCCIGAVS
jgi:sulfatase modifying factor 1